MGEYVNPAKIFGENVFNDTVMQERLPKNVYKKLKKIIEEGGELDLATADTIADEMKERAYGGLEIQIGYCNGNNKKLNAVEYHRSSELDIAVDDLILLLGCCTSERYEYRTDRSAEKDN